MAEELEQVLADARGELAVLRRRNGSWSADAIEEWIERVAAATEEWRTFLSEGDAVIRSGFSAATLRARFERLRRDGHARLVNGKRYYRACALPRRANITAAETAGREAARALKRSA